ncbi:ABC transporter permease [Deinococcus maricopensis]|uniref:ABC-type transporter, integral membrane subunit n=1 Tax=Deinococcus maricopensis (strain DSM 21211 / LMG 22137 / NRRL B-23946 / LB-34) TaxID=709986 RepID=E8U652_DEIML|nr:iron ABC transporter permease [Deinococcus maricopensis]ADV66541.1 ABC-type transporter, integral membrane subunit [Deinococcus maricopensis DSM 21211]
MSGPRRALGWLVAAPALAFLLAFLALPLVRVLREGGVSVGVWADPYFRERLAFTLAQALGTSALAVTIGTPLAYLLSRYAVPGKATFLRALLLPFVTPTLVAALGLLALLGPHGLLGVDLSDTPGLIVLGNLFFNLPVMIRLAYAAFARVPANALNAARTLGASGARAAWTVAAPLALPGILAGATLVFLYSALSFGLPLVLGGERYATLEVEIYTLTAYELRLSEAGALVGGQLLITLLATGAYLWLARTSGAVQATRALPRARRGTAALLYTLLALVAFICFAPLLAVTFGSVRGTDGLTGAFWAGLIAPDADPPLTLLLGNTLRFAGLTLLGALTVGGTHALGAWLARSRTLDLLSLLPLMVSPISLAVGYLLLYPTLRAELPLLIAAYTLLAAPLVTRSLLPALRAVPPRLTEAARTLGSSPLRAWGTVTLPLVLPALRGGGALALATVLGEFAATLVLTRPEWATLSTAMYERLGRPGAQNLGEACALATLLMLLALAAFTALDGGKGEIT